MADASLPGVRALFFDTIGTVTDWRGSLAREVASFFTRHAFPGIDAAIFADAWNARYGAATEEVRSGGRSFATLDVLHRENLEATLRAFDIDPESIADEGLDGLNMAWHRLEPWPDSIACLQRLKTRYIIGPLSGGNTAMLVDMAKHAGLPWDVILGSDTVQAYKPLPQAYLRTVDYLGLKPHQACLVAAHNDDLAAARGCGMRTAFFPRPTEHGPAQTTDLAAYEGWDLVASDFASLAKQLIG